MYPASCQLGLILGNQVLIVITFIYDMDRPEIISHHNISSIVCKKLSKQRSLLHTDFRRVPKSANNIGQF